MPTKLGEGGHGQEEYDEHTGKYVDDGIPNKVKNELDASIKLGRNKLIQFSGDTSEKVKLNCMQSLVDIKNDFPLFIDNLAGFGDTQFDDVEIENIRNEMMEKLENFGSFSKPMERVLKSEKFVNVMKTQYNFLKEGEGISVAKTSDNQAMEKLRRITFNPKMENIINLSLKHNKIPEIYKANPIYAYATHEIGHHIYMSFKDIAGQGKQSWLNDIIKEAMKKPITEYASKDYDECVAEAFADYYVNRENANDSSKEIVNYIKDWYDE